MVPPPSTNLRWCIFCTALTFDRAMLQTQTTLKERNFEDNLNEKYSFLWGKTTISGFSGALVLGVETRINFLLFSFVLFLLFFLCLFFFAQHLKIAQNDVKHPEMQKETRKRKLFPETIFVFLMVHIYTDRQMLQSPFWPTQLLLYWEVMTKTRIRKDKCRPKYSWIVFFMGSSTNSHAPKHFLPKDSTTFFPARFNIKFINCACLSKRIERAAWEKLKFWAMLRSLG